MKIVKITSIGNYIELRAYGKLLAHKNANSNRIVVHNVVLTPNIRKELNQYLQELQPAAQ